MQLETINFTDLPIIYGIHGKLLEMPNEAVYVGSMLGVLEAGETTCFHRHHDNERFIILHGQGKMSGNNEVIEVAAGDIINLLPGEGHILINKDQNKNFVFVSIWWSEKNGAIIPNIKKLPEKINKQIIIVPPPTPNGDLHLGHLAGPYLAADILKRFLLQQGTQALLVTGSDDHQSYVALKAKQSEAEYSAEKTADKYSQRIQTVFNGFDIQSDLFYRPLNNKNYIDFIQNYFLHLFQSRVIQPKEVIQPYCQYCQLWLFEAHLSGLCLHCHLPCGGGSCETCGMPNNGVDIINSYCKYCRQSPTLYSVEYVFFSLEKYRKPLQLYLNQLKLPSHIRSLVRQLFSNSLPDIAISHNSDWGISAPFPGFEKQKICTWSEMAPAYLFAMSLAAGASPDQVSNEWQRYWNDINIKITLLFGFDNTFFYTILLPALLIAYEANNKLPDEVIYNEFYLFEEKKFSTSRSHAVWAKDILKCVSSDCLRYFLTATRPEFERTNFSYGLFVELINKDLAGNLSEWLITLAKRVELDFNGVSPDGGEWNIEHEEFINYLQLFLKQYKAALNPSYFLPSNVIKLLRELVVRVNKLAVSTQFLQNANKANRLEYQTSIVIELTAVKYYALASAPIMPQYAAKLAKSLNISPNLLWETQVRLFPKGIPISGLSACTFKHLTLEQLNKEAIA